MKCAPFDYVRAGGVEEVVTLLAEAGGEGKILAGGQSLVPVMALRLARPTVLVDINRIPGLDRIRPSEGAVEVGALVRHSRLAEQTCHPLLAEAARWIGHAAIRARGTAGGSSAAVAVGTDATVTVAGPSGTRTIAAEDLFLGALTTSLADDEMITMLRFPLPTRWGFAEFARRHGDFALVTAVVAEIDGVFRITLGGVASVPVRARQAERLIADGDGAGAAAEAASAEIEPTSDLHGSASFRRAIAGEMVRRALAQAGVGE